MVRIQARSENNHEVASAADTQAEQTRASYIEQDPDIDDINNQQRRMRLSLSETDHMFFEQLIRGLVIKKRLTVASHKRLKFAYGMLEEQLIASEVNNETFSVKQKLDRLVMLRSCITQECYVILVTSDNRSEAYRLFSTLNDRGKPLSNADLLRSKTLELLTERESYQQQAQKAWRGIISDEQANSNHFLTSYYPSQLGERASSNGLFEDY